MPDTVIIIGFVVVIAALCFLVLNTGAMFVRLNRLQRQMDALIKHFGIDLTAAAVAEAQALLKVGRKIEAIKVYREYTGVGLAEAKTAVERLM